MSVFSHRRFSRLTVRPQRLFCAIAAVSMLAFTATAQEPAVKTPSSADISELARLLAKKIEEAAAAPPFAEQLVLVDGAAAPVTVLEYLPAGTYAEHGNGLAPTITNNNSHVTVSFDRPVQGTRYVFPDGRRCLVVDPRNEKPAPEQATAFRYRFRYKGSGWASTITPLKPDTMNAVRLAVQIRKEAVAPSADRPVVLTTHPPTPDAIVAALNETGLRADSPTTDPDHTDALGRPLPAVDYVFTDGRRCRVVDVAGNNDLPLASATPKKPVNLNGVFESFSDPAKLARQIASLARVQEDPPIIFATKPASPEPVLASLPTGTRQTAYNTPVQPQKNAGFRIMEGTRYTLPDGKRCVVLTVAPANPTTP